MLVLSKKKKKEKFVARIKIKRKFAIQENELGNINIK